MYVSGLLLAQTQMLRWSLPGKQIYFNPSPTVSNLPTSVNSVVSNATTDNNGNLLFYIINRNLYSATGTLCGTFNTPYGAFAAELAIVPVPTECKKYYIIFCSNNQASLVQQQALSYAKVDASGAAPVISQQTTLLLQSITGSTTACVGIAVSKVISGTNKRFLFFLGSASSTSILSRFDITSAGINNKVSLATTATSGLSGSPFVAEASELELSPDGSKLAWTTAASSEVNIVRINPITGNFISATHKLMNNGSGACYGLEWNSSSNVIYVSHYTGLRKLVYSGLIDSPIASSSIYNNTHLELARDGKIYAVNNTGNGLGIINTTNSTVTPSPLVFTALSLDVSNTFYTLPDQVDGEDYLNFMKPVISIQNTPVCTGSGNQITLNAIPNNYPNYSWYHSTDGYVGVIGTNSSYNTPANSNTSINYKVCTTSSTCGTGCSPLGNVRWCAPNVMCCIPKRESGDISDETELVTKKITIIPNPSNGNFQINLYDNTSNITSVKLFDLRGKLVKSVMSDDIKNIDASEMPTGIYFVEVNTNSEKLNTKISIQR